MKDGVERVMWPGGRREGVSLFLSLCLSLLVLSLQSPVPLSQRGAGIQATGAAVHSQVTIAATRPVVTLIRETVQGLFAQHHQLDQRDSRAGGMSPPLLPSAVRLAGTEPDRAALPASPSHTFIVARRAGTFRLRDPPFPA